MINIPEILVANGTGAFLVLFLLLYRIRIAQTNQFDILCKDSHNQSYAKLKVMRS